MDREYKGRAGAVGGAGTGRLSTQGNGKGVLLLFILCLMMPIGFQVFTLFLSPTRLFLLAVSVPFVMMVIMRHAGRITLTDQLFLAHGLWIVLSLMVVEGVARLPFAGITAVEMVGGYFVGRVLVRSAADYRFVFRSVFIAMVVLVPFVVIENLTGRMVIPDLLRGVFVTPFRHDSAYGRMGLERVYAVFDHPILWGLFCSLTLSNFIVMSRGKPVQAIFAVAFSVGLTFTALSSAPLLACVLQLGMLAWGQMFGGRWKLLTIMIVVAYVAVDLISDRTPVRILIDRLTFNPMSGYVRIAIFDAGWAAAKSHPLFGIGFNDWPRPAWVTSSVDNFWLLTSMRFGLVGAALLILACATHIWAVTRTKLVDPGAIALREGHMIGLAATFFILATVHVWGTLAVFVMFYIGAGSWIYTTDQSTDDPQPVQGPTAADAGRKTRYSRFPVRPGTGDAPSPRPSSPGASGAERAAHSPSYGRAAAAARTALPHKDP